MVDFQPVPYHFCSTSFEELTGATKFPFFDFPSLPFESPLLLLLCTSIGFYFEEKPNSAMKTLSRSDSDLAARANELEERNDIGIISMEKKKVGLLHKIRGFNWSHKRSTSNTSTEDSPKGKEKPTSPRVKDKGNSDKLNEDSDPTNSSDLESSAKKLLVRPGTRQPAIAISDYDDLPDQFKVALKKSHISEDELRKNPSFFFSALSCLYFFSKQSFIFQLPGEDHRDLSKVKCPSPGVS